MVERGVKERQSGTEDRLRELITVASIPLPNEMESVVPITLGDEECR